MKKERSPACQSPVVGSKESALLEEEKSETYQIAEQSKDIKQIQREPKKIDESDEPAVKQVAAENLAIAQANSTGVVTEFANRRAVEQMKSAFKLKTRLQRSPM